MVCRVVTYFLQEFTTPPKDYSIQSLGSIVLFQEMYPRMRLEIWTLVLVVKRKASLLAIDFSG